MSVQWQQVGGARPLGRAWQRAADELDPLEVVTVQEGDLLDVSEASRRLGVSRSRGYQLVAQGTVPSVRLGRSIRVPRMAFEAWLRHQSDLALSRVMGKEDED
ncbi:MAG: helix-turn-helix domain-containing protein [Chloroflexota bacterium]